MSDAPPDPPKPKVGSLRDRIAAFESKPAPAAAPAPAPSRPARTWKPKPVDSPPVHAAPTQVSPIERKPSITGGGMSASDARESIQRTGGTLKERMAALQGKGAFGAPTPPPIAEKPRALKKPVVSVSGGTVASDAGSSPTTDTEIKHSPTPITSVPSLPVAGPAPDDASTPPSISITSAPVETSMEKEASPVSPAAAPPPVPSAVTQDEPQEAQETEEDEERQRRAAIAQRMAKLGGARLGMGAPMFSAPMPKPVVVEQPHVTEMAEAPTEMTPDEQSKSTETDVEAKSEDAIPPQIISEDVPKEPTDLEAVPKSAAETALAAALMARRAPAASSPSVAPTTEESSESASAPVEPATTAADEEHGAATESTGPPPPHPGEASPVSSVPSFTPTAAGPPQQLPEPESLTQAKPQLAMPMPAAPRRAGPPRRKVAPPPPPPPADEETPSTEESAVPTSERTELPTAAVASESGDQAEPTAHVLDAPGEQGPGRFDPPVSELASPPVQLVVEESHPSPITDSHRENPLEEAAPAAVPGIHQETQVPTAREMNWPGVGALATKEEDMPLETTNVAESEEDTHEAQQPRDEPLYEGEEVDKFMPGSMSAVVEDSSEILPVANYEEKVDEATEESEGPADEEAADQFMPGSTTAVHEDEPSEPIELDEPAQGIRDKLVSITAPLAQMGQSVRDAVVDAVSPTAAKEAQTGVDERVEHQITAKGGEAPASSEKSVEEEEEEEEANRRKRIAERMAKLGGVNFAMPQPVFPKKTGSTDSGHIASESTSPVVDTEVVGLTSTESPVSAPLHEAVTAEPAHDALEGEEGGEELAEAPVVEGDSHIDDHIDELEDDEEEPIMTEYSAAPAARRPLPPPPGPIELNSPEFVQPIITEEEKEGFEGEEVELADNPDVIGDEPGLKDHTFSTEFEAGEDVSTLPGESPSFHAKDAAAKEEEPSAITAVSPTSQDSTKTQTLEEYDDDDPDPIDPSFYSPPSRQASRSGSRMSAPVPVAAASPISPVPPTSEAIAQEAEEAKPAEDEDSSRRQTIASRMAKLGGINFGAPLGLAPKRAPPPKPAEVSDEAQAETTTVDDAGTAEEHGGPEPEADAESEDAERARKQAILARLVAGGGRGFGMVSQMPTTAAPPPPGPRAAAPPLSAAVLSAPEPDTMKEVESNERTSDAQAEVAPPPPPRPNRAAPQHNDGPPLAHADVPQAVVPPAPPARPHRAVPPLRESSEDSSSGVPPPPSRLPPPITERAVVSDPVPEIKDEEEEDEEEEMEEEENKDVETTPPPPPAPTRIVTVPKAQAEVPPPLPPGRRTSSSQPGSRPTPPSAPPPVPPHRESTKSKRETEQAGGFVMVEEPSGKRGPTFRTSTAGSSSRETSYERTASPSQMFASPTSDSGRGHWELPQIPSSSLELGEGVSSVASISSWDEDDSMYHPVSAPPPPPPKPAPLPELNADQLMAVWGTVGTRVLQAASQLAEQSRKAVIGDGSGQGFVLAALDLVPVAAKPVGTTYGHLIFSQTGQSLQRRTSDVMEGDVVVLSDAEFKGRKGLTPYHVYVGRGGDPLVGIVNEFEPRKSKIRVFQTSQHANHYPTIESVSYRLDDLKHGSFKVYRVAQA